MGRGWAGWQQRDPRGGSGLQGSRHSESIESSSFSQTIDPTQASSAVRPLNEYVELLGDPLRLPGLYLG